MAGKDRLRAPPKLDLTKVEVTLEQTKVYRNGRQQARLRLDLESSHGGEASDLTPTEIASIALLDYHNTESGAIPFSDDGSATYQGWSAQRSYRGYEPHPDASRKPRARQSYFLYVSADAKAVETVDLSFLIKGDDLSIWRTNGRVTIDGVEQANASMDKKVGITMTPVSPVTYPTSAFILDRQPLDRPVLADDTKAAAIFNDIVTVSIQRVDGTALGIRAMSCEPASMIHWLNKLPGTTNPCFTGYAEPGQLTIYWSTAMTDHFGSVPPPLNLDSAETDIGVIVLCGRVDIPTWIDAPEDPVKVTMTDAHGSEQVCHIGFVKGERDELIVT